MVKIGVMNVTREVDIFPIVIFSLKNPIVGYGFGRAEKRYVAKFCKKYETPIADIITDILGALRSGLYAIFSVSTPRAIVAAITSTTDTYQGSAMSTIAIIMKYPAIMNMSPCAKLISLKIP